MKAVVHYEPGSARSESIADAMDIGINRTPGDSAVAMPGWEHQDWADVGVAYGWAHPECMRAYKRFVHIDLGWWERKPPGRVLDGYHKVCVDRRQPFLPGPHPLPPDRFARLGLKIAPWRTDGGPIILAGMSAKSAATHGLGAQEWEMAMIRRLRAVTDRPIILRHKPSYADARPIPGTMFSQKEPIEEVLAGAWALVTKHSNAAIDALLAGVPVHVEEGPALQFSTPINMIEKPRMGWGREQLMADLAYQQWNLSEIMSGECWKHLRETELT